MLEKHDIFARHRSESGTMIEIKVKLTPKDDKAAYSQSFPMPIQLKKLNHHIYPDEEIWDNNSTALLQVRKNTFCSEETERKNMSESGLQELQHLEFG